MTFRYEVFDLITLGFSSVSIPRRAYVFEIGSIKVRLEASGIRQSFGILIVRGASPREAPAKSLTHHSEQSLRNMNGGAVPTTLEIWR